MSSPNILVVSEKPATVKSLRDLLAERLCSPEVATSTAAAMLRVRHEPTPDLVLLELDGGNCDLRTLQDLRHVRPDLSVVVISVPEDTRRIVEAVRLGALDYLTTPVQDSDLEQVLLRHLNDPSVLEEAANSPDVIEDLGDDKFFVAASPAMRKVRVQLSLLANVDVPVLILGESGTGKEIAARLVHRLSSRSNCRFLKVNCAALPADLLESELFGYERGAFTGAQRTKPGKFEQCDKGTILLDELAEMPTGLQAKLLHVLQDKQFFRLGGEATIDVDVRILAATNVNLEEAIAERRVREDLYYRMSAFTICLPPLRERQEEIPTLLNHFMERMAAQYARRPVAFSRSLIDACLHYAWPGNLRELENFVKRYLVMGEETTAIAELLPEAGRKQTIALAQPSIESANGKSEPAPANGHSSSRNLKSMVRSLKDETEIQAITQALRETRWNRKRAARLLNISYRGLLYKIRQHGITRASGTEVSSYTPNGSYRQ